MDSRAEIYLEEFNDTNIINDFLELQQGTTHYQKIFDKYGVTHALLYVGEVTDIYMSSDPGWKKLYQSEIFVLYEKVNNE